MIGLTVGQWEAWIAGIVWVCLMAGLAVDWLIRRARNRRTFTDTLAHLGAAVDGARRYQRR